MFLAEPKTEKEEYFITANIDTTKRDYWFGLNDRANEEKFVFTRGQRPVFTNWGEGEPDDGWWFFSSENCVLYHYDPDFWNFYHYQWDDVDCDDSNRFICESNLR